MEDAEARILELEAETQRKVSASLSKIEVALSAWESAKRKPKDVSEKLDYLKKSYSMLSEWEKRSLKGRKDIVSAADRLMDFVYVCQRLQFQGVN
jgi:DNA-binding transcriptional regulator YiaG